MIEERSSVLDSSSTALLIAFPGGRRIGKARHVAELFVSKSKKAQKHYWNSTAQRYLEALEKIGIPKSQAVRSLGDFRTAVQREIDHLQQQQQAVK